MNKSERWRKEENPDTCKTSRMLICLLEPIAVDAHRLLRHIKGFDLLGSNHKNDFDCVFFSKQTHIVPNRRDVTPDTNDVQV